MAIVILPLSEISSKITVDRGFTSSVLQESGRGMNHPPRDGGCVTGATTGFV